MRRKLLLGLFTLFLFTGMAMGSIFSNQSISTDANDYGELNGVIYYEDYSDYSSNNLVYYNDFDVSNNFDADADPATFSGTVASITHGAALYSEVDFDQTELFMYLRVKSSNYEVYTRSFGLFYETNGEFYKYDITTSSANSGYHILHHGATRYTLDNGFLGDVVTDMSGTEGQWNWLKLHTYQNGSDRALELYYSSTPSDTLPYYWNFLLETSSTGFYDITEVGVAASINSQSGSVEWQFDDLIVSTYDVQIETETTTEITTETTTEVTTETKLEIINGTDTENLSLPVSPLPVAIGLMFSFIAVFRYRKR